MPFKTFGAGDVLTAGDVNDYLMEQAVITCTSGTRPSSPGEGMTIYETDTDRIYTYDGTTWRVVVRLGAWVAYTPTVSPASGSFVIGNGTLLARYTLLGQAVCFKMKLTFGSTTTIGSGSSYSFGLPPVTRDTTVDDVFPAILIDSSASTVGYRSSSAFSFTTNDFGIILHEGSTGQFVGPTAPWTWANGDIIRVSGTYQAA
ncbi:hypothetical protein [Micromonospora sp. DT47]|uniref:hypothetical protein n=1 Tax=Micromonospora sp. DT47 TaxID=3393431 RepID=UPI003CFB3941